MAPQIYRCYRTVGVCSDLKNNELLILKTIIKKFQEYAKKFTKKYKMCIKSKENQNVQ